MYAVIRSGGKQYKVSKDDVISVEKLSGNAGDKVDINEVLMIGGKGDPIIGDPIIKGATVNAEVVEQTRAEKIIVFKKKRRHNYRRKNGHQQHLTMLKIVDIKEKQTGKATEDKAVASPKKEKATKKEAPAKKAAVAKKAPVKKAVKASTKTRSVKKKTEE
jgi:large subunit ribosomal protein L21